MKDIIENLSIYVIVHGPIYSYRKLDIIMVNKINLNIEEIYHYRQ